MPATGEIKRAREIERKGHAKFIWHACENCGKERWVEIRKGKPKTVLCPHCSKGGDKNWRKLGLDIDYYTRRRANQKRYYLRHRKEFAARAKANRAQGNLANRKYNRKLKLEVLSMYGGNPPKCACCDEEHIEFLGIDHINGRGNKHRKSFKGPIYNWLKKNNYPLGYRVLCMNCNSALGHYGYCPHQKKENNGVIKWIIPEILVRSRILAST